MAIRLGHDGDDFAESHEINVTPFIDVILVLLIIFMIAAPLATVDVPVDLPSTTVQKQQRPDKPVFLTIKADRTLAIGDDPVPRESLASTLETAAAFGISLNQGRVFADLWDLERFSSCRTCYPARLERLRRMNLGQAVLPEAPCPDCGYGSTRGQSSV